MGGSQSPPQGTWCPTAERVPREFYSDNARRFPGDRITLRCSPHRASLFPGAHGGVPTALHPHSPAQRLLFCWKARRKAPASPGPPGPTQGKQGGAGRAAPEGHPGTLGPVQLSQDRPRPVCLQGQHPGCTQDGAPTVTPVPSLPAPSRIRANCTLPGPSLRASVQPTEPLGAEGWECRRKCWFSQAPLTSSSWDLATCPESSQDATVGRKWGVEGEI